jgi:hypothetical protein
MKLNLLNTTSAEFDASLVKHFTEHYSQFDIDEWHIILHNGSSTKLYEAQAIFKSLRPNIRFYEWNDTFLSSEKIKLFNKIISKLEGYILLSDIDELQEWPQEPKHMLYTQPVIGGKLIDRLPIIGKTKPIEASPTLFEQYPLESNISAKISNSYTHKPCVFHKSYRLINSHELQLNGKPVYYTDSKMIDIAHFKFTDTRLSKTERRITDYKKANAEGHPVNYLESEKLLGWLQN